MSQTSIQSGCSGKLCIRKSRCKTENCINSSHHIRQAPKRERLDFSVSPNARSNYCLELPVEASYKPLDSAFLMEKINSKYAQDVMESEPEPIKCCSDKCETIDLPDCPNCGKLLPCACSNPSNSRGLQCDKRWCQKCPPPVCSVPKASTCLTSCTCVPNLQISCGPGSAIRPTSASTSKALCACKGPEPAPEVPKEPEAQIEDRCNCKELQEKLFEALPSDSGAQCGRI